MSLVNDMLRDLDRRNRLPSDAAPLSFSMGSDGSSSVLANWKVLLLVVVGIVVGVTSGFMFFGKSDSSGSAINTNPLATIELPVAENSGGSQAGSGNQNSVSIFGDKVSDSGFVLRIISANNFDFEIVSRDDYGINVLIQNINNIAYNDVNIDGVNIVNFDAGVSVDIRLSEKGNYLAYEERGLASASGKTLIIEAVMEAKAPVGPVEESLSNRPASMDDSGLLMSSISNVAEQEAASGTPEPVVEQEVEVNAPPVRIARELSFEEQDIRMSQNSAQLIQRGQFMAAYGNLLEFVGNNVEAHHSREVLATLLFAQQEYEQANAIVDQGLSVAPNYSAYKRIKARLYLLNNEPETAVGFLSNLPPALSDDTEYFELLATAQQQSNRNVEAIETYQNLIRHDSQQARWWVGMGVSHEAMGNSADAISSYQAAIQIPELDSALRQYSQNRIRYLKN